MRFYSIIACIGFAILAVLPAGCNRSSSTDDEYEHVQKTRMGGGAAGDDEKMENVLKEGGGYQGPKKHKHGTK
jgi:hypothetical protein